MKSQGFFYTRLEVLHGLCLHKGNELSVSELTKLCINLISQLSDDTC